MLTFSPMTSGAVASEQALGGRAERLHAAPFVDDHHRVGDGLEDGSEVRLPSFERLLGRHLIGDVTNDTSVAAYPSTRFLQRRQRDVRQEGRAIAPTVWGLGIKPIGTPRSCKLARHLALLRVGGEQAGKLMPKELRPGANQ